MVTPGHELKLGRAAHHFSDVDAFTTTYLDSNPYEIRREENPDTGLSFWIRLTKKPTEDIALAAGDCIHNMRSALDHIVYEMSCAKKGGHVTHTGFPILKNKQNWDAKGPGGRLKKASGLYQLREMPQLAVDLIERLQPYNPRDPMYWPRERLAPLHELDIADKHRNLNLAVAFVRWTGYGHDGPAPPVRYIHQEGRLDEGAERLLLRFDPSVDLKVKVYPHPGLEVVFSDPPMKDGEVRQGLNFVRAGVEAAIIQLRQFPV